MLNRSILPALGPQFYKTYRIDAPPATHYRPAKCSEVECGPFVNGWKTLADETTTQGAGIASYIRRDSGRRFVESREAGITVFTFEPGQMCFGASEHRVSLERPPIFQVVGGDFRGNPRHDGGRVHVRPEDWVDDFATHQAGIADLINNG